MMLMKLKNSLVMNTIDSEYLLIINELLHSISI